MDENQNQLSTDRVLLNQKNAAINQKQIFTDREASAYLRISQVSLWRLRKKRKISYRRISSKIAYTIDDLTKYLESTKQKAR